MNKKTQTFVVVLAMTLTLTFGLSIAYGQNTDDNQSFDSLERNDNDNSIVGTWVAVVTQRNCQTGEVIRMIPVLNTFNQGGTMMEGGSSLTTRGPGHGTWEQTRRRQYSSVFMFLRSNPDGTYNGFQKIRRFHTLNNDTLTTNATFENFNAGGLLVSTGCATETATRLTE